MLKRRVQLVFVFVAGWLVFVLGLAWAGAAQAAFPAQQPTVGIATVTGTPSVPIAIVNSDQDQINARSGPGTDYPIVGVLVAGQRVPVLGRSPGGDWVQVVYPGVPGGVAWVYAFLVRLDGSLPIIEPPPTPTPRITPTIDPTLAAQFIIEFEPTRLPTFTAPPPLMAPTYSVSFSSPNPLGVPTGFIIAGLGLIGLFGLLISFLSRR